MDSSEAVGTLQQPYPRIATEKPKTEMFALLQDEKKMEIPRERNG
jgi:hypothetical protein